MMMRVLTLATAAALIAGAANAAEIRIPVAGKSAAQLRTEINFAARRVCREDVQGSAVTYARCVQATAAASLGQLKTLRLASAS